MAGAPQGNRNTALIVSAAVIVVLVGVIAYMAGSRDAASVSGQEEEQIRRDVIVNEENVEEVIRELEAPRVRPGNYEVKMNTTWHFPDGVSPSTDAYVENVTANTNDVFFDVELSDTDEVIYESPILPRGTHTNEIVLMRDLDPGEYPCRIIYHLVDDNQKTLSTLRMKIMVVVDG